MKCYLPFRSCLWAALLMLHALPAAAQTPPDPLISLPEAPSIGAALQAATQQSGYRFLFQSDLLNLGQALPQPAPALRLSELLARIETASGLRATRSGMSILLRQAPGVQPSERKSLTVSGYVTDSETGEKLVGASVRDLVSGAATQSNEYGYYALSLRSDSCALRASYIGYLACTRAVRLKASQHLDLGLMPDEMELEQVVIEAQGSDEAARALSQLRFEARLLRALPALGGEADLMRGLQLLPGFQGGTEGSAGFFVRGSSPDQNLVILDGVPLYNVSHLFGFLSVFNADAIQHVDVWKGAFPARYGGRLASVLDISLKEGNLHRFSAHAAISPVASRLRAEGPLLPGKASFFLSARRSFLDPFLAAISRRQKQARGAVGGTMQYAFYDFNAKVNAILSPRDRVFFSYYQGRDRYQDETFTQSRSGASLFESEKRARISWGNRVAALRWNHLYGARLFSNLSVYYTRYQFSTATDDLLRISDASGIRSDQYLFALRSEVEDWGARWDFSAYPSPKHRIRWGLQATAHRFMPGAFSTALLASQTGQREERSFTEETPAQEGFAYAEDEFQAGRRFRFNLGLHGSLYRVGTLRYPSLQPRFSARFSPGPRSTIEGSFSRMTQFLHLLSNSGIGLPTDLWIGASEDIGPQDAWQGSLGYARQLAPALKIGIEAYFKDMKGLYAYREGVSFFLTPSRIADKLTAGEGQAYGIEGMLERSAGKTTGWISYAIAWSTRRFPALNGGQPFPFTFDRRHDLAMVLSRRLSQQWALSGSWELSSGRAVTLPLSSYAMNLASAGSLPYETLTPILLSYGPQNSARFKPYHRLDLSLAWEKPARYGMKKWAFSLFNAYSRLNTFYILLELQDDGRYGFLDNTLFPIIPGVSYEYTFTR